MSEFVTEFRNYVSKNVDVLKEMMERHSEGHYNVICSSNQDATRPQCCCLKQQQTVGVTCRMTDICFSPGLAAFHFL